MIKINKELTEDLKQEIMNLCREYNVVFAWDHTQLKRIDPKVCQHRITLKKDARLVRMHGYRMNPNYAQRGSRKRLTLYLRQGSLQKWRVATGYSLLWWYPRKIKILEYVWISRSK